MDVKNLTLKGILDIMNFIWMFIQECRGYINYYCIIIIATSILPYQDQQTL